MPDSVCVLSFHLTELVTVDAMATVDAVVWWCRLCDHQSTATTRPAAHTDAVAHLTTDHHATIGVAP